MAINAEKVKKTARLGSFELVRPEEIPAFEAAAHEMRSGLLPSEIEDQLADIGDADLRSTVERTLVESNLSDEAFEAYFSDPSPYCIPTPLIPFGPERTTWMGHVTTGKTQFAKAEECECSEVAFATIVTGAFGHKAANNKDGFWFFPAKVEPVARSNDNVRAIYGATIDVDDGTPAKELIERIAAVRVAAVIATSFSNMKTSTGVALSTVKNLTAEGKSPAEILMSAKGYRPAVAEGATLGDVVETKGRNGKKSSEQTIHHRPCPKHRILVPYIKPLLESDFDSHQAFVAAHKQRYRAVAKLIGVENHDRACENPARIFYTARYRKGAPHFSIELPGRFIDPNDPEILALAPEEPVRVSSRKRSELSAESVSLADGDFNFMRWAACGFADNFLIADALEARHPDAFFDQSGGEWRSIYCPHDSHEQNGGSHVKNADPFAEKGLRGFCVNCLHNTCAGEPVSNDRLMHLAKMVEIRWLSKSDLIARDFFAGSDADYAQAMARLLPQSLPSPFRRTADGICHVTPGREKGDEPTFERVCDDFALVGQSKNEFGEDHSAIIEFVSDGAWRRERIPMAMVQGDPKRIRENLAGKGLFIDGSSRAKGHFDTLMSRLRIDRRILNVTRPGFHRVGEALVYVSPTGQAINADGECADILLSDAAMMKNPLPRGTFSDWYAAMEAVAKAGNPHWVVGACSGFAGPLVNLLEMDSTGIALIGETSTGKSFGQGIGAAVWGDPDPGKGHGLFRSARTTDNGLENRAALSHGSLLAVDDLANTDPKMISKLVFLLAGGSTKERQNADGSARASKNWAMFYTLSSERSISDLIKMGGDNMLGGHAVRLPTVNVTGARILPPEELTHVEAFKTNYGHAWQPFIAKLFTLGYVAEPTKLRNRLDGLISDLCGLDARSTERRAAIPFALLWLGGEIARDSGALPVIMDIESAVRWAWDSYRNGTEADGLAPMDRAINAMRATIQAAWETDLPRLNSIESVDPTEQVNYFPDGSSDGLRRPYRPNKWGWYDNDTIYIFRDMLAELAGRTDTPLAIAKELKKRGFLVPEDDRLFHKHLKGRGAIQHYQLRRAEFLGTEADGD